MQSVAAYLTVDQNELTLSAFITSNPVHKLFVNAFMHIYECIRYKSPQTLTHVLWPITNLMHSHQDCWFSKSHHWSIWVVIW